MTACLAHGTGEDTLRAAAQKNTQCAILAPVRGQPAFVRSRDVRLPAGCLPTCSPCLTHLKHTAHVLPQTAPAAPHRTTRDTTTNAIGTPTTAVSLVSFTWSAMLPSLLFSSLLVSFRLLSSPLLSSP
eukprot:CAMPEP_0196653424 /NCGR_PEP_ID=MMETSP1086-20130531/3052_1 /TAXON_ID=77921 /ORGANISM="Cyanoptyche  gloeocystis , Strain SAG4.97" /LENGTH=127 /DNA_ID=CAMNT_0041984615 /DNA_START=92 /DNA_END=472 /DNA_ORIENTATION=-